MLSSKPHKQRAFQSHEAHSCHRFLTVGLAGLFRTASCASLHAESFDKSVGAKDFLAGFVFASSVQDNNRFSGIKRLLKRFFLILGLPAKLAECLGWITRFMGLQMSRFVSVAVRRAGILAYSCPGA